MRFVNLEFNYYAPLIVIVFSGTFKYIDRMIIMNHEKETPNI